MPLVIDCGVSLSGAVWLRLMTCSIVSVLYVA